MERAEPELTGPNQAAWFARLEQEHDNIRGALAFSLEQQAARLGQRIGGRLWRFWWIRGHLIEGHRWLEQILALPDEERGIARGRAVFSLSALAEELGDWEGATTGYRAALEAGRASGDVLLQGHAFNSLSNVAHMQGSYEESVQLNHEARACFEEAGYRRGVAGCLHNLATVEYLRGNLAEAEAGYRHAMAILEEIQDERSRVMILANIGVIAFERRDFETARDTQAQTVELMRAMGDEIGVCNSLANLAGALRELGDSTRP